MNYIWQKCKLLSSRKETFWISTWIFIETRKLQRSQGISFRNSDKSIYAVVHWATLPKWNADKKKKDQRMLSRTEQELGIARERWCVWQKVSVKGRNSAKSELLGKAKSSKCHVTCLQHRSKDTPTFPPAWLYKTK